MSYQLFMAGKVTLEILVIATGIGGSDNLGSGVPERTGDDGGILHGKVVCHQCNNQEQGQYCVPQPAESLVAHTFFGFHRCVLSMYGK